MVPTWAELNSQNMTFLPCWKVTGTDVLMLHPCSVAVWGGHRLCVANASSLQKGEFLLAQKQSRRHPLEGRASFIAPECDLTLPLITQWCIQAVCHAPKKCILIPVWKCQNIFICFRTHTFLQLTFLSSVWQP